MDVVIDNIGIPHRCISFCILPGRDCGFDQLADMLENEPSSFDPVEYERKRTIDRVIHSLLTQLVMDWDQYRLIRQHMEYIYDIVALKTEVETTKRLQKPHIRKDCNAKP